MLLPTSPSWKAGMASLGLPFSTLPTGRPRNFCMQLSILLLNGCATMPGSSHACQTKLGTTWNHPFRILQNPSELLLDHWMLLVLDWNFGFLRFSEQIWSLRDTERFPPPGPPGHFLDQVTGYIWRHPQGSHVLQGLQGTLPVRLPGAICQHLIVATPGLPAATPATPKP